MGVLGLQEWIDNHLGMLATIVVVSVLIFLVFSFWGYKLQNYGNALDCFKPIDDNRVSYYQETGARITCDNQYINGSWGCAIIECKGGE
jgi:hypothetical protein